MTGKTESKHEQKTRETRVLLLQAAETIFVRDGYEGAELGEIASLAGRTKGSIYAQFKSKEDIFLALVENRTNRYRAEMERVYAELNTVEANMLALRNFYVQRAVDDAWSILLLEYKLYAMRHPESKKRLQDRYSSMFSKNDEGRFADILGSAAKGKNAISRVVAIQSLQPIVSALVLEKRLETSLSEKNVLKKVISRLFDALMEVPTS